MTVTHSTGDGLARYLTAATLARGADAGAPVGLALLATLRHGPAVGGLLTAALTAPHLLGPWVARRLDVARDGRRLLAAAFATYGVALAGAALLLGHAPLALVVAAVLVAGACGPLLTGGLSSRLEATAGKGREGWDALSYGLAGTAGPALVALASTAMSPLAAVIALAAAAALAALAALALPRVEGKGAAGPEAAGRADPPRAADRPRAAGPPALASLRLLVAAGPLRRVNLVTLLAAFGTGGLAVIAAVLGSAELVAAFGLGNLAGSLLVTARPLRGEPARMAVLGAAGLAAALGLAAVAPHPATFALAGFANAPFFTATLAARARYAPPEARAQVFVSMAGLKIAAASAGAAVAGATIAAAGPRALLAAGAAVTLLGALTARGRHSLQACPSSPRPNAPGSRSSAPSGARSSRWTIATPTSAARTLPARSPRR